MSILEKNLNKYQKLMKGKNLPAEIQMKKLHEEAVNKKIQNLIPSSHVIEINTIANQISESTGYTTERVYEAIMKSDTRKIIMNEVKGVTFVKRKVM